MLLSSSNQNNKIYLIFNISKSNKTNKIPYFHFNRLLFLSNNINIRFKQNQTKSQNGRFCYRAFIGWLCIQGCFGLKLVKFWGLLFRKMSNFTSSNFLWDLSIFAQLMRLKMFQSCLQFSSVFTILWSYSSASGHKPCTTSNCFWPCAFLTLSHGMAFDSFLTLKKPGFFGS